MQARTWSLEGALRFRNFFGYGDHWDAALAYGFDQASELSAGVTLPKLPGFYSPMQARVSLLSQDWLKFSSYKEKVLGLSLSLFSSRNHDLSYNLAWRNLTDPSQMASKTIRRQLGHSLLSSLKYTFKVDRRNSTWRPTKGYAFASTTQVGGLSPDSRSVRFLRQVILPFPFCIFLKKNSYLFSSSGVLCFHSFQFCMCKILSTNGVTNATFLFVGFGVKRSIKFYIIFTFSIHLCYLVWDAVVLVTC